eukprot:1139149-Alexandrium_andersonii.AAC.1
MPLAELASQPAELRTWMITRGTDSRSDPHSDPSAEPAPHFLCDGHPARALGVGCHCARDPQDGVQQLPSHRVRAARQGREEDHLRLQDAEGVAHGELRCGRQLHVRVVGPRLHRGK